MNFYTVLYDLVKKQDLVKLRKIIGKKFLIRFICSMIKDNMCDKINYDKTVSVLIYLKEKEKRWEIFGY